MSMEKQQLQSRIDSLEADCDRLVAQYGQGVRPSWVSADLALNYERIERTRQKLKLLDIESPCDEWLGGEGIKPPQMSEADIRADERRKIADELVEQVMKGKDDG